MLKHSTRVAIIAVAFVASGFAAGAATPADPCGQVSAALGETVAAGQKSNAVTCTYIADKPIHQVVSVSYSPPGDWNTRKTRLMPGVTKQVISGLGTDALAETAANFTTLYVMKGTTVFMVRVYGVSDPARQLAIETAIAQAVAAKI
jgi:hypothetical protein